MAIDRHLWQPSWPQGDYPSLPCPSCGALLNFDESSLDRRRSTHNSGVDDSAGIDEALSRFIAWYVCGHAKCNEFVSVTGDCTYENAYDEDGETVTEFELYPRSLFPGPPVIEISPEVSPEICAALSASFQLFWSDKNACAGKLRIVLELLLRN